MSNLWGQKRDLLKVVALYLLLVLLSAGAIWILSGDARRKIDTLAVASADSSVWTLANAQTEHLRMTNTWERAIDGEATLRDVRLRFDIFYSRMQVIRSGAPFQSILLEPEISEFMAELQTQFDMAIPIIDANDDQLKTALPQLLTAFAPYSDDLRGLSRAGIAVFSRQASTNRVGVSNALRDLGLISFFLLSTLFAAMAALIFTLRSAQTQAAENAVIQNRLQAVVSSSIDGILVVDRQGTILDFNDAAERIFGYSRQVAFGKKVERLIFPPDSIESFPSLGAIAETKGETAKFVRLNARRRDGTIFPVELSMVGTRSEDEKLFAVFVRDISRRVQNERDLVEARDRALLGEKAKADLLAIMSHEMRTPLNGVLGTLQLLSGTSLNKKQKTYLGMMETSGKLLLERVNDVLDISQIDAGLAQTNEAEFDPLELAREVVDGLETQAAARGNTLKVLEPGKKVGRVVGDETRLRQVLANLVGNAIKFTENGDVLLELEREPSGDIVTFRVIDSGIGIAPDRIETIFDDFVTGDTAYSRETGGTGLGLGIVQRLVAMLGGEIGVESTPGEGSVFWFELTLPKIAKRKKTRTSVNQPGDLVRKIDLSVLVVEDNDINRQVARDMLKSFGCRVAEAVDGKTGVQMAEKQAYDLILMDISMPKMDGIAATKAIRGGTGPNLETTIVALTAHALPDDVARFKAAGMDDVVTKPLSSARLIEVLIGGEAARAAATGSLDARSDLVSSLGPQRTTEIEQRVVHDLHEGFGRLDALLLTEGREKDVSALAHRLAGAAALVGFDETRKTLIELQDAVHQEGPDDLIARLARCRESLPGLHPSS